MELAMAKQSTLPDPGEPETQWYEILPDRLEEEIRAMREAYPDFKLYQKPGENLYWIGTAKAFSINGSLLYSLDIKVECPPEYPKLFPAVFDIRKVLKDKNCPHLTDIDNVHSLCYGNRLDPEINFQGPTRVKDVLDYVGVFLARQWHFEEFGYWPDGQPHGYLAFLEYEIKVGAIDPIAVCPCGLYEKKYKECHMIPLWQMLDRLDVRLKREIRANIKSKMGRNKPCLCGGGRKWKKCCLSTINYPSSKSFLLLKFPGAFGMDPSECNAMLQAIIEPIQKVTLAITEKM